MSVTLQVLRNLQHAPRPLRTAAVRWLPSTCRYAHGTAGRTLEVGQIKLATLPVAKKLKDTGLYVTRGKSEEEKKEERARKAAEKKAEKKAEKEAEKNGEKKAGKKATGTAKTPATKSALKADKTRVHIASEALCDDILAYVGKGLERHKGCDILDLYPGAGVWSSKLHEFLQPRSHILMEPDDGMYAPFLEPLLEKPGTVLVPKSGILWKELATVLTPEFLPHQKIRKGTERDERNDTLLVIANIAFHPKKKYARFDSIVKLVIHQFLEAIRSSSLFQQYGQVRMLIWMRSDEVVNTLAPNNYLRRKTAINTEIFCDWVREVCTPSEPRKGWYTRDNLIDDYIMTKVIKRMENDGVEMPPGRETALYTEIKQGLADGVKYPAPGVVQPRFKRAFEATLEDLEQKVAAGKITKGSGEYNTFQDQRLRSGTEWKKEQHLFTCSQALDRIHRKMQQKEMSPEEIKELGKEWNDILQSGPKTALVELSNYRSNILMTRPTPALHVDRRPYEPLGTTEDEFFPNIQCSLLDIQPKPLHPLLRQTGRDSNRAGDTMEFLMGYMIGSVSAPIHKVLDSMWPGATDYIMPRWTSLRNPEEGGFPYLPDKYAAPTPRILNARHWEQLLEIWMDWPFRPDFPELIARFHEVEVEDESKSAMA